MKDYPQMREQTLRLLSDLPQDDAALQRMVDDLYEQDPGFERVALCAAKRSPTHMTLEEAQFLLMPQSPDETANYIGCFLAQGYMGQEQLRSVQSHLTKAWMDRAKPDICWSGAADVRWNLDVGPVRDVVVKYQVTLEGDYIGSLSTKGVE